MTDMVITYAASAVATLLFMAAAGLSIWSIRKDVSHMLILAGRAAEKREYERRLKRFGKIGTLRTPDGRFASKREYRLQQLRNGD